MARTAAEKLERQERLARQAGARMEAANARQTTVERKMATRRKIIIGSLMIDAAEKDENWRGLFETLMRRVDREQDRRVFEGWTLNIDDGQAVASAVSERDKQTRERQSATGHAPFRWDEDSAV